MLMNLTSDLWFENEANIYGLQIELCRIILSNTKLVFFICDEGFDGKVLEESELALL